MVVNVSRKLNFYVAFLIKRVIQLGRFSSFKKRQLDYFKMHSDIYYSLLVLCDYFNSIIDFCGIEKYNEIGGVKF